MSGNATNIEDAARFVRQILVALAAVTIATVGPGRVPQKQAQAIATAVAVAVGSGLVAAVGHRVTRRTTAEAWATNLVHLLDVLLFIGVSVAVQAYVSDAAWALLVIPIVLASLRFAERAVVLTWILCSAGYLVLLRALDLPPWGNAATLMGRVGVLLAVAAAVALLARWLREGWWMQTQLTNSAEQRIERLATIESAVRAMRSASSASIPRVAVEYAIRLGFHAATVTRGTEIIAAAGDDGTAPAERPDAVVAGNSVHITRWVTENGTTLFSAGTHEPFTNTVITGWSHRLIDEDWAVALHDLVANTTSALEAADHLERIHHRASHDPLTDLANRAEFHRQLDRAAANPGPIAVLYIDLDVFKPINDNHGHHTGDKYLIIVAERLRRAVGVHGLAARLGGDEFAVLLTGAAAHHTARFGRDLADLLKTPITIDGLLLPASASIGTTCRSGPTDAAELVKQADTALYAAKTAGRGTVRIDEGSSDLVFPGPSDPSRPTSTVTTTST